MYWHIRRQCANNSEKAFGPEKGLRVPHLLTEEQKTQCLKCAWELLKTYKGCNSRIISNLLTGDEIWVHMFEHKEGLIISNGSEKIKNAHVLPREPSVQKRCCTQFSLIQVGQSFKCLVHLIIVTGRFYKNSVLKKVKEFYNKKRPSKGWSRVHLLHDNASSHKCEVVKSFLASEKVKVLNHPPYSPNMSSCDFFLFPRFKKMLSGNKYTLEVLFAVLFISVSNRYQKKTIYLLFATG